MKIIAIIGQKGGTGKTTFAENLAVEAAKAGKSVVLIDLDPQVSSSKWGDRRKAESPAVQSVQAARLPAVLEAASKHGIGLVVIDTPPHNSDVTITAARAADLSLVPIRPNINDVETLPAVRDLLTAAGSPTAVVVINAAPVQGQRHTEALQVAEHLGFRFCPVVVHQRNAYGDAASAGKGVSEFEPDGKADQEMKDLYKFAIELFK